MRIHQHIVERHLQELDRLQAVLHLPQNQAKAEQLKRMIENDGRRVEDYQSTRSIAFLIAGSSSVPGVLAIVCLGAFVMKRKRLARVDIEDGSPTLLGGAVVRRMGTVAIGSFLAGLVGIAVPWKYYLLELRDGRISPTDYWGGLTLEAYLFVVLLAPVGILGAIILRCGRATLTSLILLLIFGGLASAYGVLTLVLFAVDPKWYAGIGCYAQVVGALAGLACGVAGLALHIQQRNGAIQGFASRES